MTRASARCGHREPIKLFQTVCRIEREAVEIETAQRHSRLPYTGAEAAVLIKNRVSDWNIRASKPSSRSPFPSQQLFNTVGITGRCLAGSSGANIHHGAITSR